MNQEQNSATESDVQAFVRKCEYFNFNLYTRRTLFSFLTKQEQELLSVDLL